MSLIHQPARGSWHTLKLFIGGSLIFVTLTNVYMVVMVEDAHKRLLGKDRWRWRIREQRHEYERKQMTVRKGQELISQGVRSNVSTGQQKKALPKKKKPLNILLLYGDDWRHDSIGSASGGLVKTPFFDNLAKQGMRFTHNCVTTSVCWISRASLYTGQYVSRHKSTEPTKPEFYKAWNQTFPYLLREAGYYFGHVGKWHFKGYAEFIKPQLDWERPYYGRHWWEERGGLIHTTKKNERDAIAFLQDRPKDKPFCLTVCFFTPHAQDSSPEQYLPQNESMKLYVNDTIPLAPSATKEAWEKMPMFFGDINAGRTRFFKRFDTQEKYQKMMKNYYRLISEIDHSSGV
jgi:arylsulfatase A-like enzyme